MAAHVKLYQKQAKKVRKRRSNSTIKSSDVKGRGKNTRIKAAQEPKCEIFISGIDNVEVTPDNKQNYMASNFINVVRLVRLSGENKKRASYLLVVPISSYDKVTNDATIWEDGNTVGDFTR